MIDVKNISLECLSLRVASSILSIYMKSSFIEEQHIIERTQMKKGRKIIANLETASRRN